MNIEKISIVNELIKEIEKKYKEKIKSIENSDSNDNEKYIYLDFLIELREIRLKMIE